jgi:hypothetical protein
VTYKTITNSNEAASAWVTTIFTVTSAEMIIGIQMNGWNFVPASTISSSTSTSSSSTTTQSTTSSPTVTPAGTTDNTGRNIGIGVGVSLGTIGILSAIFAVWFVRRRRRSTNPNYPAGPPQGMLGNAWGGYGGGDKYPPQQQPVPGPFHEMQASKAYPSHEMEGTVRVGELDGAQAVRY